VTPGGSRISRRALVRAGVGASLGVAAILSGCAPGLTAPGPSEPPRLEDPSFMASDGVRLPLTRWRRTNDPSAIIIALHGFNDYANAFREVGPFLANRGFEVWAPDQRGFGRAPHRGLWPGTARLTEDLRDLVALARARWPGRRVVVLGESMGGAVAMVAADTASVTGAPLGADGLALSAPAVWGRNAMPWLYRAVLDVTATITPWARFSGSGLDIWPSDNIEMLRTLGSDPLMIRETRADTIQGLVDLMDAALTAAARVPSPVLMMAGINDHIIPAEPAQAALIAMIRDGADPLRRPALYPDGWHMLLRDLGGVAPLEDIVAWVRDPAAPLPSGADDRARAVLAGRIDPVPRERPAYPAY